MRRKDRRPSATCTLRLVSTRVARHAPLTAGILLSEGSGCPTPLFLLFLPLADVDNLIESGAQVAAATVLVDGVRQTKGVLGTDEPVISVKVPLAVFVVTADNLGRGVGNECSRLVRCILTGELEPLLHSQAFVVVESDESVCLPRSASAASLQIVVVSNTSIAFGLR